MKDRNLGIKLVALSAAMFAFGFALVPIYDVFCDLTGFGGRTGAAAEVVTEQPDESRRVRLEFVASVNRSAPFELAPQSGSMEVTPGRIYNTAYFARNLSNAPVATQSVPSVAPGVAAEYLKKIECFCFTEQAFDANESREMGVTFMLDPALPEHIDTLSLSYTLFALDK